MISQRRLMSRIKLPSAKLELLRLRYTKRLRRPAEQLTGFSKENSSKFKDSKDEDDIDSKVR